MKPAVLLLLSAVLLAGAQPAAGQAAGARCGQAEVGPLLHYCLQGSGPVTVVLEAGMRSTSRSWRRVSPEVSAFATVLTYDRAGLGESGPGPTPRTSVRIADELRALLDHLGVEGPLVLVGHSIGGRHLRTFAASHPEQVAALLLLDSPHEDFDGRRDALLTPEEWADRERGLAEMRASIPEGERLEYEGMDATPASTWDHPLPPVPLRILAATRHGWVPARSAGAQEAAWQETQRALAALSPLGEYRTVEAGHNLQLETPGVVVEAIRELVREVEAPRDDRSRRPPVPAPR